MTDVQRRIAQLSPAQRELLERRLAGLAAARTPATNGRIQPRDRSRPTPLAFQQEREWAIAQFRPANNIPAAFRVFGALDVALVGRMLRRWKAVAMRPFEPAQPLRLRAAILRVAADEHIVVIATDHAAADLVSLAILVRELATLYARHRGGAGGGLPPLPIQYGDFAAWQREFGEQRMAAEVAYWRQTLEGFAGLLAPPSDRPFPARPTFAGAAHYVDLPPRFVVELDRFTERSKASLGVVLLAACSVLLYRYLGQDDLVIGELVAGRSRAEVEQLIGCFVTALPLRMELADEHTLHEVLQQARHTVLTAYDHQDLPIDRLMDELDLGAEAAQTYLSHMWIDVRIPERSFEVPGLRVSAEPVGANIAAAPLTVHAYRNGRTLQLQWTYMTEMFDADTVARFAEQFNAVLQQLVSAPQTTVAQVPLALAPAAPVSTGSTARRDGAAAGFVELFQRRVALAPHAPAVICDGAATSYVELNREANRLARYLRARGVGPETRVGVLFDRSPRLAAAILGVLKAGGAYVPLDPAYAPVRMAFMLADAGARVLVTEQRLADVLAAAATALPDDIVLLDGPCLVDGDGQDGASQDLPEAPEPASLAYVVYTSGSTGRPEGAMIEHRSLVTFARNVADRLGLGAGDRFLQFASPSIDVLAEELFPTWLAGGTVVIPTQHIMSGGVDLAELVERERLTVMELPTAYWHVWVRELDRQGRQLPSCLRLVIIGGERVLPDRLAAWRRHGVPLMHVYGLTETTVSSTFFPLDPADPVVEWPNLPIGTPLSSADLRILDRRLRPVPLGAAGELYIGGISLARGYLDRPGLTAQRFVADAGPDRPPGQRLYRTGDLVRQRADGNLEFLSRVDTQIKIRGFRVEPTAIESALSRHPNVAESVVTAYEPVPGDRRLVAYVVAQPESELRVAELRRFLERELPAYMVPSAFVRLDAVPLTANGKVDRDRLPAPDAGQVEPAERYVAPQTPVQQTLADVFEVGGDSILAIQVVAPAREAVLRLSPYDLFAHPTVAELAGVASAGPTIDAEQGDVTGPVPLAATQRWFCSAGIEEPHHWNRSVLLELGAPGQPELLRTAVEHLLAHHDGLRQRFLLAGERSRVRIASRGDPTPFEVHDLSGLDEAEQSRRLPELTGRMQRGLNLAVGPLMRVALIRFGGRRPDRLAIVAHRLAVDTRSMRLILEDLETAVVQVSAGERVTFLPKTTSWQSWCRRLAAYAATEPVQAQRRYWTDLVTPPAGRLPVDGPTEPAEPAEPAENVASLGRAATDELLRLPTVLDAGVAEVLLAALGRTLGAWTGVSRHVVDLLRHDREHLFEDVDLTRTVGWFSRGHPLAVTAGPADSPEATLRMVKDALGSVPLGGLGWRLLRQDADPVPSSPAQVLFSYLGPVAQPASGAYIVLAEMVGDDESPRWRRPYPIEVHAAVHDGELRLRWRQHRRLHDGRTIEGLAERHLDELRAVIAHIAGPARGTSGPSDFPLARVDRAQLDDLLSRLAQE
jgi:amino acid adenylation domain-containing protein/non-ribosomal peptide synthase protein (TIGR01720 family)